MGFFKSFSRWVLLLMGVGLLLSACGQKGPLYMPGHKPPSRFHRLP